MGESNYEWRRVSNLAEVRVIARSAARKGRENQLRELLRGMSAPTRADWDVNCMNCMSQTRRGASISTKFGRVKVHSIDTQPVLKFEHLEQTV